MLKDFTIANMLDLTQTIAGELFEGKTYPWEVLPEVGDFIVKLGKTLDPAEYDYLKGDIWIAKSAKVAPTACINGPAIIGKNTEVRHCAFIRGKALVGEGCVVGNPQSLRMWFFLTMYRFLITIMLEMPYLDTNPIWEPVLSVPM